MRETDSREVYQGLNRELHALIYAAARMPRLSELIDSLRNVFEPYVGLDIFARPDPDYSHTVRTQHEQIGAALQDRSPRRARKLMREHLESNRQHIADSVKVVREGEADGPPEKAALTNGGLEKRSSRRAVGVKS